MTQYIDITPDVNLLEVMRHNGITNLAAICELIDNSIDAGASKISIHINNHNEQRNIMIIDNGKGITYDNIKDSLILAKQNKTGYNQLGKFGMGLKTAALSLTREFEVFTKPASDNIIYSSFNINLMKLEGRFIVPLRQASPQEIIFFNESLNSAPSGTIILLKNCDGITTKENFEFIDEIYRHIGRVYRWYIKKGIVFEIVADNQLPINVKMIDPLMRYHDQTVLIADSEKHRVTYIADGKLKNTHISLSASLLPESTSLDHYELKINQTNQGIYILRENREVASALTYEKMWGAKHNSKNRWRIEVSINSDLDGEFNMDFNKGKGNPTAYFKEELGNIIDPILEKLRLSLNSPLKESVHQVNITGNQRTTSVSPKITAPPIPSEVTDTPFTSDRNSQLAFPYISQSQPINSSNQKYEISERIAVLSEHDVYTLEFNLISWSGDEPKYDLRIWNHQNGTYKDGITFSKQDAINLKKVFMQYDISE